MLVLGDALAHLATVAHEGKVVVIATSESGALAYTIKQDGFEDSYLSTSPDLRTGWEPWIPLELPNEEEDASVCALEKAELTYKADPDQYILRSVYRSKDLTAVAPVQLVSLAGHLYLFRQSRAGTLLCDRFVLDGMTNRLTRKLDVRFKRSRQRNKPSADMRQSAHGLQSVDSLDFRDTAGDFFYEPTTELCLLAGLRTGHFSVAVVPTNEQERYRWHFFLCNEDTGPIEIVSVRASEDGLFDVKDHTVLEARSERDQTLAPRSIPGIIRRSLSLGELAAARVTGLAATRFDIQKECEVTGQKEPQLLRTETRLLFAVGTDQGTAALSFALAADGTLSAIDEAPQTRVLRSNERTLLLPLNTLEQVRAIGDATPPARGTITGLRLGTADDDAEDLVVVASPEAAPLVDGDTVEIRGTPACNGLYKVSVVDGDAFLVEPKGAAASLGTWEKQEEEAGLIFDGMITGYERTADGKLKVLAHSHGLVDGDEVQFVGTVGQDGTYPIRRIDDGQFIIDRRWAQSEAINVRLESRKRRGLVFDGTDDYVALPPQSIPAGKQITITLWARGGSTLPRQTSVIEAVGRKNERLVNLHLPWWDGVIYFDCGNDGTGFDRIEKQAAPQDYRGEWVHWAVTKDAALGEMKIYRNGALWHEGKGLTRPIPEAAAVSLGALRSEGIGYYEGTLAELCVFSRVLGEEEIRNQMYVPLTGREIGLVGTWRLGAIFEDTERKVIDSSSNGNDGIVYGGAYAGAVTLGRTLSDGTPAVKYANGELFAVTQRASYIEDFEFKVNATGPVSLAMLNDADGTGRRIFSLGYWGKTSRSAEASVPIVATPDDFIDLGGGWFRASAQFTVPDEIALVRSFELQDVRGAWDSLEIRRHRIRLMSDCVREASYKDAVTLLALGDSYGPQERALAELARKEQEEVALRKEKRELEANLAALAQLNETRQKIRELKVVVADLEKQAQGLKSEHVRQVANPFNYVCSIACAANDYRVQAVYRDAHLRLELLPANKDSPWQRWYFLATGGAYYVRCKGSGDATSLYLVSGARDLVPELIQDTPSPMQPWAFELLKDGSCYISCANLPGMRLQAISDKWWYASLRFRDAANDGWQRWRLIPSTETSNSVIENAYQAWKKKADELSKQRSELARLEELVSTGEKQRQAWEARLLVVIALINKLLAEISALNTSFLDAIGRVTDAAQEMPIVATDHRKLVTRGARLPFVRPASRLTAIETCEGNVQLSYFDDRGRMRQTLYDATADRRNTAFEQWLPDAQRACLQLDTGRSVVALSNPLVLEDEWAVEGWFTLPLPPREWNVLVSDESERNQHVAVFQGKHLGARIDGCFFSSGFSLADSLPGWHHVCVTRRATASGGTLGFYLDGNKVGERPLPLSVLVLDGADDSIALPGASLPIGKQISVCFFVRDDRDAPSNACMIEALDASNQRLLGITLPGPIGKVTFECGLESGGTDRIEKRTVLDGSNVTWTHWAFTKNAGTSMMRIFRNGVLFHSVSQKRKALPAAAKVIIGRSLSEGVALCKGQLAELCIWSKELTEEEVQVLLGRALSGTEEGLCGYWKFEGAQATDRTSRKNPGTYSGAPQLAQVPLAVQSAIGSIGNILHVKETEVDETVQVQSVLLDGVDDYVELPATAFPTTGQVSVSLWTRGSSKLPAYSSVISAPTPTGSRMLNIHLPWIDERLYFDCGGPPNRLVAPLSKTLYQGTWSHWVFTKNVATGTMTVFANGQQIHSITGATSPIPEVGGIFLGVVSDREGTAYYPGEIAEVSIWDRALSLPEVQVLQSRPPLGTEPGLCGFWQFQGSEARDCSPNRRHGAFRSGAAPGGAMERTVRVKKTEPGCPFGKIAEVRIWSTALSDDEVAANSLVLLSGNEPGLLAYFPLTEGRGTEARDATFGDRKGLVLAGSWGACAAPIGNPGHAVMKFDGIDDAVVIPGGLLSGLPAFTVEGWVRASSLGAGDYVSLFGQNDAIEVGLHQGRLAMSIAGAGDLEHGHAFPLYEWHHIAAVGDGATLRLYLDGLLVAERTVATAGSGSSTEPFRIGAGAWSGGVTQPFSGLIAEVRAWRTARTPQELRSLLYRRLTGAVPELIGCWPLVQTVSYFAESRTPDLGLKRRDGTVSGAVIVRDNTLPIGGDALVSAEYSTINVNPATQRKVAMMRRLLATPSAGGALLVPDKRVDLLQLQWVGNGQFAPTLLGYIEGAPPVPSENLTVEPNYNGATAVELTMTEDVEFRWDRTQDSGLGANLDLFLGADTETYAGFGAMTKAADIRAGAKGSLSFSYQFLNQSNITTSSSQHMTDRLELRGSPEQAPKFANLGRRFIPKNVGYALVISSLADVFVTRLVRSGRMVGYQVRPVEGVPPDVNTITFLMNPAYVMQGSLDGMTGSTATSQRFFRHVPEMRAQYGSLYPASYYRLKEAYDLKQQIESDDKRRESYFAQFNARLLDEGSLSREVSSGAAPTEIGVKREEDKAAKPQSREEQEAADKARTDKLVEEAEQSSGKQTAAAKKKQAEIDQQIADQEKRAHASECFASWQKKMEDILIRAGKRNIVNTYVWDADGGLHAESQSFANTAEHTIGGSFTMDANLGFEGAFGVFGAKVELTALATVNLTQTLNKTESRSKGIELSVDLSGVESTGVTDHDDLPILPGEKVDRYRFMSFYLEGSSRNFYDFFSYVVDPEWLRSNDEEARALRQAQGKANKTWRVLHRVTYVERPALMGFGRDVRPSQGEDRGTQEIISYFDQIETRHKELVGQVGQLAAQQKVLQERLDQILGLLTKK